jgi:ParB/RepB/Spo0J family partition protein
MNYINIKQIIPDENQPRKMFDIAKLGKLKKSIEKYGIINPLVVEEIGKDKYMLIDGERRFRAANELGIKEVPVNIVEKQSDMDRMIRQFHIQEQQEGWTPAEKAMVLFNLSQEMGVTVNKACELLGIESRTGSMYISFAKMISKDDFQKKEIPIRFVESIIQTRDLAKKTMIEELEEKPTRTDEKSLEKIMMDKIEEGEIKDRKDFAKLKASFIKDPKTIKTFLTGKVTIKKIFEDSEAASVLHLRNIEAGTRIIETHLNAFLKDPNFKPSKRLMDSLQRTLEKIESLQKLHG